jgi:peptide methionine sulfoxide reductase msrA/msrB
MVKKTKLSSEESNVIRNKATEAPYTGEYWNYFRDGIYVCRQCGLPLFDSKAKFEAGCGWPSFDKSFPLAVKELLDNDGERIEILCARCGGHLGHVFRGEKLTQEDTRHCANSLSIRFVSKSTQDEYIKDVAHKLDPSEIVIGGGCFWCIEAAMLRVPGILDAVSGYAGGSVPEPKYEAVCSGETGHAEVVKITYDKNTLSLEELLDMFFKIHDPTSKNKQGNDIGTQYRSIILYMNAEEEFRIKAYISKRQSDYNSQIVTEVSALKNFYAAESYHQRYFEKNPYATYCQIVVKPKIDEVLNSAVV